MKIKLFYSYSHKDEKYSKEIEKNLSLLKKKKLLDSWSDRSIAPGSSISKKIEENLNTSHIFLFLLSSDFIASDSCKKEWEYVKGLSYDKTIYRIPIILKDCPWQEFLNNDDVKALPKDGKPVNTYKPIDNAYKQIYNGIEQVIKDYKNNLTPKKKFLQEINKIDFISQDEINIEDIFVFPQLEMLTDDDNVYLSVESVENLLSKQFILVHGEEVSGKTTLCKYLFLNIIKESSALFVDLKEIQSKKPNDEIFKKIYEQQFEGDYDLWKKQDKNKTIIFDNLFNAQNSIQYVKLAEKNFDSVIIFANSDDFHAYFKDDAKLAKFSIFRIKELSHVNLEKLIKKRLSLKDSSINYEKIDHFEDTVIQILSKGLIPKYPFFILSILQTFEGYMPDNISISSYGHCYKALILAHLIKSGISRADAELNPCINFLEHYAFHIFKHGISSFDAFKEKYNKSFTIAKHLVNKLTGNTFPAIIEGDFKQKYEYYYFLGAYLAKNKDKNEEKSLIEKIAQENYVKQNNIILLFVFHHSQDISLIEHIVLNSMCALDRNSEATLDVEETKSIFEIIEKLLPKIAEKNVEEERKKEREQRDLIENIQESESDNYDGSIEKLNDIYKILKNNQVFAQIIRNHHGNFEKETIKMIIQAVISSGLRLIKIILLDEKEISTLIKYLHSRHPDSDINKIKKFYRLACFVSTMHTIEHITYTLSVKEISDLVAEMVKDKSPAHELIRYFSILNTTGKFSASEKEHFSNLYKKYQKNLFIQRVISLRTIYYFNTHEIEYKIKQSICSQIGISYTPNKKQLSLPKKPHDGDS